MTNTAIGARGAWIRDLALIGAASALAPAAVVLEGPASMPSVDGVSVLAAWPAFVVGALVAGAATGALLGAAFPRLLLGPFSRLPVAVMLLVGAVIGAAWGGIVGAAAALVEAEVGRMSLVPARHFVALGAGAGAVAGALQLGWFWLPYTLRRARGRPAWPVVVAACAVSAGLGRAAVWVVDRVA